MQSIIHLRTLQILKTEPQKKHNTRVDLNTIHKPLTYLLITIKLINSDLRSLGIRQGLYKLNHT